MKSIDSLVVKKVDYWNLINRETESTKDHGLSTNTNG